MLTIRQRNGGSFYATTGSAGFDVCASEDGVIQPMTRLLIGTGLFIEKATSIYFDASTASKVHSLASESLEVKLTPELQIRARSGLSHKHGIMVVNGPATIDSDYIGDDKEIKVNLFNSGEKPFEFKKGDRIAQAVMSYVANVQGVEVKQTIREGGHGSTGV